MVLDVIVVMSLYYSLKKKFEGETDINGKIVKKPTLKDQIYGIILTGVYSFLVILFNIVYKEISVRLANL